MYTALKNNYYYNNSVCKDYRRECTAKIYRKKKSAQKRNELEIKLISILLIIGNIVAFRQMSPSFDSFFGNLLKFTVIFSVSLITSTAFFKKIKTVLRGRR